MRRQRQAAAQHAQHAPVEGHATTKGIVSSPLDGIYLVTVVENGDIVALGNQLLGQVVANEGVATALWEGSVQCRAPRRHGA